MNELDRVNQRLKEVRAMGGIKPESLIGKPTALDYLIIVPFLPIILPIALFVYLIGSVVRTVGYWSD